MIVLKFGGTSLESAEAIERMESIVQSRLSRRPVVVVSALGKVTDNLLALGRETAAGQRQQALERFVWLRDYHFRVAGTLIREQDQAQLAEFLEQHFNELHRALDRIEEQRAFTPQAQAEVASFGERLSSRVVAMALRKSGMATVHLDTRSLIRTDDQHTQATPLLKESYAAIRVALGSVEENTVPVVGGFIGSTAEGVTTVLGRNSSNLTAVLFAGAMGAEEVEIWTDVDGVFRQDPRQIANQHAIDEMSFDEALEMANRGAKVFHPGAMILARRENIPMWIKNSRRPEVRGTRVSSEVGVVRSAALGGFVGQRAAGSD
jgi:aspartate kinase